MTKVQIVENEDLLQYADFGNCEVWLLNKTNDTQLADASLPMDSKDSGSEIVLRSIEQLKALSPIDLTPSGITMFLTNELAKAFGPMFTMSSSILPLREKNNVLFESTSDKLSSLRK